MRISWMPLMIAGFIVAVLAHGLPNDVIACDWCADIEGGEAQIKCYDGCHGGCCVEACDCGGGTGGSSVRGITDESQDNSKPPFTVNFGAPIPEASGLRALWTATGTPGVVEICDDLGNCRQEPYDLRVLVRMLDDAGAWPAIFAMGGFGSAPSTVTRSLFPLTSIPQVWDPLRDGVVDLQITPLPVSVGTNETATILTPATMHAEIDWIALVNQGVPTVDRTWSAMKATFDGTRPR